jgi:type IV pilus assembly protein PilQ
MGSTTFIPATLALLSLIVGCAHAPHVRKAPGAREEVSTQVKTVDDTKYDVRETWETITALPSPEKLAEKAGPPAFAAKKEGVKKTVPRLFFAPGKSRMNQIIGIDFFMLPKGRSRIIITTSKEADYELTRKDSRTLLLHVKEATIAQELTRYIDSSYFKGAVNRIIPIARIAKRIVEVEIMLKELVHYHVRQIEREIQLEFERTSVKPPVKRIIPARQRKALKKLEEQPEEARVPISVPHQPMPKGSTGARLTLDIVDADVRNVLKLIGEVSGLNIVWGPEVKGTVSLRLKDVPWDQALAIVLRATDLGIAIK